MDIYCRTCGEPWDMDTLHDEISERIAAGDLAPLPDRGPDFHGEQYQTYRKVYDGYYDTVRNEFYSKGCKALHRFTGGSASWCQPKPKPADGRLTRAEGMSVLIDLLGDDLDGIASMMEDAEYLGMVE